MTSQFFEITLKEKVSPENAIAETEVIANRLFEAGCDDQLMSNQGAVVKLSFYREATTLGQAIDSAVLDVGKAGYSIERITVDAEATAEVA